VNVNMIALVIFAVIAVVILVQLYNVLGRKVGFRGDDKPATPRTEDVEAGAQPVRLPEASRVPNLEVLKTRDANFNEINFIEKARETYEQVVLAFHKGELDTVKDKLSDGVFSVFSNAVNERHNPPRDRLSFVGAPKADMDVIEFKDDVAQIRVRFLSELAYEEPEVVVEPIPPVEAPPVASLEVKEPISEVPEAPKKRTRKSATPAPELVSKPVVAPKPSKVYKRTAEYWTFQKGLRSQGGSWLLTKVEAAKA